MPATTHTTKADAQARLDMSVDRRITKRTVHETREDIEWFRALLAELGREGLMEVHAFTFLTAISLARVRGRALLASRGWSFDGVLSWCVRAR